MNLRDWSNCRNLTPNPQASGEIIFEFKGSNDGKFWLKFIVSKFENFL